MYPTVHLYEDSLASMEIKVFPASKIFEERLKNHVSLQLYTQAKPGFGRGCECRKPHTVSSHARVGSRILHSLVK